MVRERYNLIPSRFLSEHAKASVAAPVAAPPRVRVDSPALEVMTDLQRCEAATIWPGAHLPEANRAMIKRGVRLLLVVDETGAVCGTISAADLMGERPLLIARERGMPRDQLTVRDVMLAADATDVIELHDVLHAEVGHVVTTLKRLGRQHVLVIDHGEDGTPTIRGLFSASQIARQLGVTVEQAEVARTFAQIEAAIAH